MRFAIAVAALCSFAPTCLANEVIWFGNRTEDGASLVYGIPDSGYGRIALSCQAGQDELAFSYEHEPVDPKDGVKVDVVLSAGALEVSIPTTGTRLELDNLFILEGRAKLDSRLRTLLTSSGTLTVTVEDGIAEYPLTGAADAARHLIAVCSPDA